MLFCADDLKRLVSVEFSEDGSNLRKREEQAWIHFLDFLDEGDGNTIAFVLLLLLKSMLFYHVEGSIDCGVDDVLVFFSGTDRVPLLGFSPKPKVSFLYSPSLKFCTSSTCNICLRLPTSHGEDYRAFRDAVILSLKSNDGFGGV